MNVKKKRSQRNEEKNKINFLFFLIRILGIRFLLITSIYIYKEICSPSPYPKNIAHKLCYTHYYYNFNNPTHIKSKIKHTTKLMK